MPRWSYADDRRLIQLASSKKSIEIVARKLDRKPEAVARSARRLGVFLKRKGVGKSASKADQ